MLTFYINRAGKNLPKTQRDRLQRAKTELKRQFGKDQTRRGARSANPESGAVISGFRVHAKTRVPE